MYRLAASLLASQGGGWPVGSGVYTITEHLLYQIIQLWIYEKAKNAGILDPTAPPFFPRTAQVPEEPVEVDKSDDHNNTNIVEQTTKHIEPQHEI